MSRKFIPKIVSHVANRKNKQPTKNEGKTRIIQRLKNDNVVKCLCVKTVHENQN